MAIGKDNENLTLIEALFPCVPAYHFLKLTGIRYPNNFRESTVTYVLMLSELTITAWALLMLNEFNPFYGIFIYSAGRMFLAKSVVGLNESQE